MTRRRPGSTLYYFKAKLRNGSQQLSAGTGHLVTARRIEAMWDELADQRAFDLLEPVIADSSKPEPLRSHTIGALYDLWCETNQDVAVMRRLAEDCDLEPFVAEWHDWHKGRVEADTAKHALHHVRRLFPKGTPRRLSSVTADWLTTALAAYPGARNTRRKVHSSLSSFFAYLVYPKGIFEVSPMARVERPRTEHTPRQFYDDATVARIIAAQPTAARAAFFALTYGTGADVSPAVMIERVDVIDAKKEVRIRGTKTATRDRLVRVNDTLWPIFWTHAQTVASGRLFPRFDRWTVSDWHRQTIGDGARDTHGVVVVPGLGFKRALPLRCARHHFAVRLLRAGAPIQVVAQQLGSDSRTVLRHYGPWSTSSDDRDRWETKATEHAQGATRATTSEAPSEALAERSN